MIVFHMLFYINKNKYMYIFGENSLCNSMIGNTNYLIVNTLCDIPCFLKPHYNIPNTTYGSCSKKVNISFNRNGDYISFNEDGFVSISKNSGVCCYTENLFQLKV